MSGLVGANLSAALSSTEVAQGKGAKKGDRHTDENGNAWVFVQASAACAIYDVLTIKSGYDTTPITAATAKTPMEVGFAQFAFAADEYGWVMTNGRPTITVLVDAAANVPLYTSGTAGALDDATTSQCIRGLVLTDTMTATTSGSMAAVANFPAVEWGATLSQI
jgi:hypothetical protein